jgi:hypothetical protein
LSEKVKWGKQVGGGWEVRIKREDF